MFSSKSKDPQQSAPAMPAAPQQAKRTGRSSAPSIISSDLVVTGTLTSTGDIQIDGRVEGDVRSAGLVIGDKAIIHGEVYAEEVTVRGHIHGGIRAKKVLLCSTCHVEGNILHEAFAVETGAFFEGNCRHSDNPLAEEVRKPAATEFKSVAPAAAPAAPVAAPAAPAAPAMTTRPVDAPRPAPAAAANFAPLKTGA
ncbi:MAG TPA: polymer-forming cytoskeletal protein [Rhizomicrobium sp.]|nr:polymer-forming cytoskeletal protein [Rhizomicrobium sp.]